MEKMTIYAGLDMHTKTTTGTIKDEKGNVIRCLEVETSKEGIKFLFNGLKNKTIHAVFEASRNWFRYAELLKPYCDKIIMAHPLKVRAIASARIKTDKIDSDILSDLLRGNLIPESYMPDKIYVDLRQFLRYRAGLSRLRANIKIKIRDILSREGKTCEFQDVTAKKARIWLSSLDLNDLNQHELDYMLELLDNFDKKIKHLDKEIEKKQYQFPEVDILKSVIGISTYSALLIIAEVGDFTRFPTADKLSAYAGNTPSIHQSSSTCYTGRITKQGNKWLRWILTQCTHASIKSRKPHKLKQFYNRIAKRRGKQKAIVATSRKMLTTIWHLIHKNEFYAC